MQKPWVRPRDRSEALAATCCAKRPLGAVVVCATVDDAAAGVAADAFPVIRTPWEPGPGPSSSAPPISTRSTSTTTATRTCELLRDPCASLAARLGGGAMPGPLRAA